MNRSTCKLSHHYATVLNIILTVLAPYMLFLLLHICTRVLSSIAVFLVSPGMHTLYLLVCACKNLQQWIIIKCTYDQANFWQHVCIQEEFTSVVYSWCDFISGSLRCQNFWDACLAFLENEKGAWVGCKISWQPIIEILWYCKYHKVEK